MNCKVSGCRFPSTHVSLGHKCGKCNKHGHGQVECNNREKLLNISQYYSDIVEEKCTVPNCNYINLHTTEGHYCSICNCFQENCICFQSVKCPLCRTINLVSDINTLKVYGISEKCTICSINSINMCLPICKHVIICEECANHLCESKGVEDYPILADNSLLQLAKAKIGDSDRCYTSVYAGMGCELYVRKRGRIYEQFFMHSDDWGQYGPLTDRTPLLENFKRGYRVIS